MMKSADTAANSGEYVLPMSRAHRRSRPGAMPTSCASVMTRAPSYPTWPSHGNGTMTIPRCLFSIDMLRDV